jgi:uncharacterized metal-binding protein
MPDGRTHDDITLITAGFMAPISAGLVFGGQVGRAIVFLSAYLISGLLFSDDLDTHSIEHKRWKFLRVLWLPYQKLIPHRSWVSHGLIIGPTLRIVYFAGAFTLALWLILAGLGRLLPLDAGGIVGGMTGAVGRWIIEHPQATVTAFVGFVLGGAAHSLSDWIWTWIRHAIRIPGSSQVPAGAYTPTHHGEPIPEFAVRVSENVVEPR